MLKVLVGVLGVTFLASAQLLPQNLIQSLELTPEQITSVNDLNNSFRSFSLQKSRRTAQVQSEISEETRKQTLDPMALGLRYQELEAIRRETDTEREKTFATIQNVLNPAQKAKIMALQEALKAYPSACEAVNYNLASMPSVDRWFDTAAFAPTLTIGIISALSPVCAGGAIRTGDFTPVPVLSFVPVGQKMLALPQNLVLSLELTPEQTTGIERLNSSFRDFSLQKSLRAAQVQAEISEETRKQTLDPMALGLRYQELEAIRRETDTEQEKTFAAIHNLLNPAQKAKLTALQDALKAYPNACDAINYNLLPPPAPIATITGFPGNVIPASRIVIQPLCGGAVQTSFGRVSFQ
jgi:hypothetical protein